VKSERFYKQDQKKIKEAFERPTHQAALAKLEELGYFVKVDHLDTWYYPDRTVRIEIWKDKETYEQCK